MAIAIPAIIDTQILRAQLEPVVTGATNTASSPRPPIVNANRFADLIDLLAGLIDSGTLTGVGVHTAADATNNIAVAPAASDLPTLQTLLNALAAGTGEAGGGYAAHRIIVGASEHIGADVTNVVTAAAASNLATSITLANDLKVQFNAHLLLNAATGHYGRELTNTIVSPDATVLADCITLANEMRTNYNAHLANISAGSLRSVIDNGAFTGANSLVGATITFAAATTTVALRDVVRTVVSNGLNDLLLSGAALPAVPVVGDTWTLEFTAVDSDVAALRQEKGMGSSASNPYGSGPSIANLSLKMLTQMNAAVPSYLGTASAEPFNLCSPHGGGDGAHGHAGATLMGDLLQRIRNAVAAYTVPT
jgi:hypothetical protein